ncbi:MAG: MBL fold metallo-hydrolase [Pseudobutyrivibrio sp.]|nr:MBL fold metallo-hydrolase [Pseudobutyrivibrio sp.]
MTEKIKVFKHNSICIDVGDRAVYVDPFEMDETPRDAAFILVTHDHYDHFSPEAIEKVANKNTVLVVPEKMKSKAAELINTIAPEVAIPVHYGLITGTSKNAGEEFSRLVKSPVKVEVRI